MHMRMLYQFALPCALTIFLGAGCKPRVEPPVEGPPVDTSLVAPPGCNLMHRFEARNIASLSYRCPFESFPPHKLEGFYDSVFAAHRMTDSGPGKLGPVHLYADVPRNGVVWRHLWQHPREPVSIELSVTRWGLEDSVTVELHRSVPKSKEQIDLERQESEAGQRRLGDMETRITAWGPKPGRKARLLVDLHSPNPDDPTRFVIRWADDGSIQILSGEGKSNPPQLPTEASRWADSLESLLSRETGKEVLFWDGFSSTLGEIVVYAPKGARWERFRGLADSPTRFHEADTSMRRRLEEGLNHPGWVDSASVVLPRFLQAVTGERITP